MATHVVTFTREEMAEVLDLRTDEGIEAVHVSYSPSAERWSMVVDLVEVSP